MASLSTFLLENSLMIALPDSLAIFLNLAILAKQRK